MDEDPLVFFEPGIDGVPGHHDMTLDSRLGLSVGVDVPGREDVAGQPPRLMDELHRVAVDDGLATADRSHATTQRLEVHDPVRGIEVEVAGGLGSERTAPDGEAHLAFLY